jgi:tripartite ATP-independent transporter DctM subunit
MAIGVLLIGIPVAAVMAALGLIGGLSTIGWPMVESLGSVIWSVQNDNMMTAIPMFILLGEILLRSGLADRMYISLAAWVGRLPGGLLHANMGACALFAATCGSSVATAATIGTVAMPAMQERGYRMPGALGSLAAGGTLGILIPPSVAMLVYGSITSNSIAQLFMAGVMPGILLTLCFMTYIAISALRTPASTQTEQKLPFMERLRLSKHIVPPAIIFGSVMSSLYMGIATPTESAAMGCFLAIILARVSGRFDFKLLHHCFKQTASLTGMIILIICGAFMLNVTLTALSVPQLLTKWITGLGVTPTVFVFIMIVFYLILGCFLEVLSMQVTTIPIAYPVAVAMGIDPIWFGIFVVLMSEIALITPPVGMNLYVVHGIRRDGGPIGDVIRGVWPYVWIMLGFVVLLWYVPGIVLWLPRSMFS